MTNSCFSIIVIVESPPERLKDLLNTLSMIREELTRKISCRCYGEHHIFVCACRSAMVKSLPLTSARRGITEIPRLEGIPMVKLAISSASPDDAVLVLGLINDLLRGAGFKVVLTDD